MLRFGKLGIGRYRGWSGPPGLHMVLKLGHTSNEERTEMFLKSASTSNTFFPRWAKAIARFELTVDLPSPGIALVTTNVFTESCMEESSRMLQRARYASTPGEFGFRTCIGL